MAMEITNNYSSYAAQSMVSSTKKKETENTSETTGGGKVVVKVEDSVRAYGNLYNEIVQGYQNGTRELYVEYFAAGEAAKTGQGNTMIKKFNKH